MSEGTVDITTLGLGLDSTGFVGGADAMTSATDKVVAATEELIGAQEKLGEADKKAAQDGEAFASQLSERVAALDRTQESLSGLTSSLSGAAAIVNLFADSFDAIEGSKLVEVASNMNRLAQETMAARDAAAQLAEADYNPQKALEAAENMRQLAQEAVASAAAVASIAAASDSVEAGRILEAAEGVRDMASGALAAAAAMAEIAIGDGADPELIRQAAEATKELATSAATAANAEIELTQEMVNARAEIVRRNDALSESKGEQQAFTKEELAAIEAGDKFVESLVAQVMQLDLNRDALLRYQIASRQLTDEQRADALALADTLKQAGDAKAQAASSGDGLNEVLGKMGIHLPKVATGALAVGTGLAAMAVAAKDAVQAFIPAEAITIRMEETFRIMGRSATVSAAEIEEFSLKVQKSTTFTDEAVKQGATNLAKFSKLSGDQFKEALAVSVNLAAVMKTDVASAAQLVGRALETAYGTMMLKRAGLMTEAQVEIAKSMKELGQTSEATTYILDTLKNKVGDAAEAFGERGLGSAIEQVKNRMGENMEAMGGYISKWLRLEETVRGVNVMLTAFAEWKPPSNLLPDYPVPEWLKKLWDVTFGTAGKVVGDAAQMGLGGGGLATGGGGAASFVRNVFARWGAEKMAERDQKTSTNAVESGESSVNVGLTAEEDKRKAEALKQLVETQKMLGKVREANITQAEKIIRAEDAVQAAWDSGTKELHDQIMALGGLTAAKKQAVDFALKDTKKASTVDVTKDIEAYYNAVDRGLQRELKAVQDASRGELDELERLHRAKLVSEEQYIYKHFALLSNQYAMERDLVQSQADNRLEEWLALEDKRKTVKPGSKQDLGITADQIKVAEQYADAMAKVATAERKWSAAIEDGTIAENARKAAVDAVLKKEEEWFKDTISHLDQQQAAREQDIAMIGMSAQEIIGLNAARAKENELMAIANILLAKFYIIKEQGNKAAPGAMQQIFDEMEALGKGWDGWIAGAKEAAVRAYEVNEAVRAQNEAWSDVYSIANNFFMDLFNNGTKAFKNLWNTFKQLAFQVFAQIAAKQLIINFAGALGLGGAGAAMAEQGAGGLVGMGSNLLGIGQKANTAYGASGIIGSAMSGYSAGAAGLTMASGAIPAVVEGGMVVAGGTAGAGGVAAGLAGGAEAALAAIGPVGWAALAAVTVALVYKKFFDKGPADRTATFTSGEASLAPDPSRDAGFQGKSALGNFGISKDYWLGPEEAKNFAPVIEAITGLDNSISTMVGPEMTKTIADALAKHSITVGMGTEKTDINASGGPAAIFKDRYVTVVKALDAALGSLVEAFEGTGQELADFVVSVITFDTNVKDAQANFAKLDEAITKATGNQTAMDVWREQGNAIDELVSNFDGSTTATYDLINASNEYYNSTVALLYQIKEISAAIDTMFASTREQIYLTGRSNEFQYNYWRELADKQVESIKTMTDPAKIAEAEASINDMLLKSFGLLDPESQAALRDQFLQGIDQANKIGTDRLAELGDTVTSAAKSDLQQVKDTLADIATKMGAAADKQVEAADTSLEAAQTPVQVSVSVTSAAGDASNYEVYSGR